MAVPVLKFPAENALVDRALRVGLEQAEKPSQNGFANLKLTDAQQKTALKIANLLGLSVQSVLNAAILFTFHCARQENVRPEKLKRFPKRLAGRTIVLEPSFETISQVKAVKAEGIVAECVVTGILLLKNRLLG